MLKLSTPEHNSTHLYTHMYVFGPTASWKALEGSLPSKQKGSANKTFILHDDAENDSIYLLSTCSTFSICYQESTQIFFFT